MSYIKQLFGIPVNTNNFTLEPIGIIQTRMFSEFPVDWIVWQQFTYGEEKIFIRGFGKTAQEARLNFYKELEEYKSEQNSK